MADWRTLSFQGYTVVERVAAVFEVGPPLHEPLPFASFTVKVLERKAGSFAAHLNVAVRRPDGPPDAEARVGRHPRRGLGERAPRVLAPGSEVRGVGTRGLRVG